MKKLTKKQRNKAYIKAYEAIYFKINDYVGLGLCGQLLRSAKLGYNHDPEELFQEFKLFNPKEGRSWWWPISQNGDNERLTALGFMIAITDEDYANLNNRNRWSNKNKKSVSI